MSGEPTAEESGMRANRRVPYRGFALLVAFSLAAAEALAGQDTARNKEQADDAAALKEFTGRVEEYLKLRKTIEKQLPAMKSTEELPEMIAAHQQALARKIREARPHARPGDLFTRATREAFRHVIHSVFQDPQSGTARAAIRQRKTAKEVRLQVNGIYPDAVAETTFPSILLQKLPTLPDELAYRIMGRDLVLVDSKANLVVDLFHEALP
jgi:septal ring factor EnvC (AmiA/AmiB activator)